MTDSFKKEIVDKLKEKNLSESSIKLYLRSLEKLNDDMPFKDFKFLYDVDKIVNKLANYKDNTKRSYLIAIVAVLNSNKGTNKKLNTLSDKYYNLMKEKNNEIKQKPTEEMTEAQKENWISWDDVKNKLEEIKKKIDEFKNNKNINENQYNLLLSYVILGLYTYNPPRRNMDYQKMNIIKKYSDILPKDTNYLDYDNKKFIFNVFKTSKKEGQVDININDELMDIINLYLKFHPVIKGRKLAKTSNHSFLVYWNSKPFDKVNCITRILNKLFDKKVGSSMLRHSFLSDKYGKILKEQQADAKAMSHTIETQKDYIKEK